jgi:hypothetical protein
VSDGVKAAALAALVALFATSPLATRVESAPDALASGRALHAASATIPSIPDNNN